MNNNNSVTKEKNNKKWTNIAFVLGVSLPIYSSCINVIFTKLVGQNSFDTLLSYFLLSFALLKSMYKEQGVKNNNYIFANVLKCFALLYVIYNFNNMVYTKQSYFFSENIYTVYQLSIYAFLTAFIVDSTDTIKKNMRYIGYLMYFSMFFMPFIKDSFISITYEDNRFTGYMNFGYRMLPGVLMMFYLYFRDKRIIELLLGILGTLELVVYANRGSVIAVVIFILLYQLICVKSVKRLRNIFLLSLLAICVYFMIQPQSLITISAFLEDLGIKSRNITKLLEGTANVSGRDTIYETVWDELSKGNLLGLGLYGDRVLLNGTYAHNFIYEILLQFGWIPGVSILVIFFFSLGYVLLSRKYESMKAETLVFSVMIMLKLFFSSSYLQEYSFYFLIAYIINLKRIIKKDSENTLISK